MPDIGPLERAVAADIDQNDSEEYGYWYQYLKMKRQADDLRTRSRSLPPWWSKERDAKLRLVVRDDGFLAAVLGRATQKISSLPFKVAPVNDTIALHVRQADTMSKRIRLVSQSGTGWKGFIEVLARDYLSQDNGCFGLVIYDEDSPDWESEPTGQILGFRVLDAAYCTRTNDPIHPVKYTSYTKDGSPDIKIHRMRVIYGAANPSSEREMNGVGYSAASVSMMFIEDLWAAYEYRAQKMGASPAERIILAKGMTSREIVKAMATSRALMTAAGLYSGAATTIIGGDTDSGLEEISLNNFDQFNTQQSVLTNMGLLGLAWGLDPSELYPVEGARIPEETAMQRSRGTFIANFIEFLRGQFEMILPDHLYLHLDYRDDLYDKERAIIQDINARNFSRIAEVMPELPQEVMSRMLLRSGLIEEQDNNDILLAIGYLPDGRPIGAAFYDKTWADFLPLPREFLLPTNDNSAQALLAIGANRMALYETVGIYPGAALRKNVAIAFAALNWLEAQHNKVIMTSLEREQGGRGAFAQQPLQPEEQPPQDQSGKSLIKAVPPELEQLFEDFQKEMLPVLQSKPVDKNVAEKLLIQFVGLAYLAGSRLRDLDEVGKQQVNMEVELMASVYEKWDDREGDMLPTMERMKSHLRRGYNVGLTEHKTEGSMGWTLGATEKHCSTCLEMSGKGVQPAEFWRDKQREGIYPGSPMLECTGLHCDCEYTE